MHITLHVHRTHSTEFASLDICLRIPRPNTHYNIPYITMIEHGVLLRVPSMVLVL